MAAIVTTPAVLKVIEGISSLPRLRLVERVYSGVFWIVPGGRPPSAFLTILLPIA